MLDPFILLMPVVGVLGSPALPSVEDLPNLQERDLLQAWSREEFMVPDNELEDASSGKDITYKTAGDYTLVSVPWAKGATLAFNDTAASTFSTVGNAALFLGGLYLLSGFPAANALANPFQFNRRLGMASPNLPRNLPQRFQHRSGKGDMEAAKKMKGEKMMHESKMLQDEKLMQEEKIIEGEKLMERERMMHGRGERVMQREQKTKRPIQIKKPVAKSPNRGNQVRPQPQAAPRGSGKRSVQKSTEIQARTQPQAAPRQSVRPPNRVRFSLPSLTLPTLRMPQLPRLRRPPAIPALGLRQFQNPFARPAAPAFRPRPAPQSGPSRPAPVTQSAPVFRPSTSAPLPPATPVAAIQRVPVVSTQNFPPVSQNFAPVSQNFPPVSQNFPPVSQNLPSIPSPEIPSFPQQSAPLQLSPAPLRPENFNSGDFSPFDSGSDPFSEFQGGSFGPGQDSFRNLISSQFGSSFDSQRLPSHR